MESLQHIITQKHELLARETFSRRTINYSEDMPADQKDRYIHYLVDKVNELDLDKRAMELAVEEFQGIHDKVLEQLAGLKNDIAGIKTELHEERRKRKSAEAKARKLDQQLKYAQKNKFGDKRQNARKDKNKEEEAETGIFSCGRSSRGGQEVRRQVRSGETGWRIYSERKEGA